LANSVIGDVDPEKENFAGSQLRIFCEAQDVALTNSFCKSGHTYFPGTGLGNGKRLDFVGISAGVLKNRTSCGVLGRASLRLQVINAYGFRDHLIIQFSFLFNWRQAVQLSKRTAYNMDRTTHCLLAGTERQDFISHAESIASSNQGHLSNLRLTTGSDLYYKEVMGVFTEAAKFFESPKPKSPVYTKGLDERLSLLAQRAAIRNDRATGADLRDTIRKLKTVDRQCKNLFNEQRDSRRTMLTLQLNEAKAHNRQHEVQLCVRALAERAMGAQKKAVQYCTCLPPDSTGAS
jgi:hypothetical protein